MKTLRVSVAQITCIDGVVEHNLSHASELATEAGKNGAELVQYVLITILIKLRH